MQIKTETSVGLFILVALGIFFYMTFNIGVFRFDRRDYYPYTVYFKDVSGLQKKADVKIAGVKVGWVESIELLQDGDLQAKAHIMVHNRYHLYRDAHAVVRQEGLLGSKYLEVIPGDPMLPALGSGQALGKPAQPPVNIDELLQRFKVIATNVEDITGSLKDVIGSEERDQLRSMMDNFSSAANSMAAFSATLDRTLQHNESNIDSMLSDFKDLARDVRTGWPSVQHGIENVSTAVDRDLNRIATKFETSADAIEEAALQARDGLRSVAEVADKINEGRGLLGKLVTEDETYHDLKSAVQGLKNYFAKVDKLGIVFDAHSENMWGIGENFVDHIDSDIDKKDAKGYFGVRIHSAEDRFYLLQAVGSRKGWVQRYTENKRFNGASGLIPDDCSTGPLTDLGVTTTKVQIYDNQCEETTIQYRGGLKFNLQLAKTFSDVALRFGLFENTGRVAIDYDIPFRNDRFRWVTSLEVYDFYGDDRLNDQRPHLKWMNRMFMFNSMYMTFGADDFISKQNANAFVGIGMRFGDDDVKYVLGSLSGASGLMKT